MSDVAGNKSGSFNLLPDVWRLKVDAAQNERELVDAVREYVATWTPEELSQLPEACRPRRITSGEDICDMAFCLSQIHLDVGGTSEDRALFERMMGIFLHGSTRFSQLLAAQHRTYTQPDA